MGVVLQIHPHPQACLPSAATYTNVCLLFNHSSTRMSSLVPNVRLHRRGRRRRRSIVVSAKPSSDSSTTTLDSTPEKIDVKRDGVDVKTTLLSRLWKVAAPYWSSDDKVQARLQLAAVFALTLGTTGISVGFNFLGRDFYNSLASNFSSFSIHTHLYLYACMICPYFALVVILFSFA
jgi:hypothetical protein